MEKKSSRVSVLVLSMALLILSVIFDWRWATFLALIVGICGILSSFLSRLIENGLNLVTKVSGYIIRTLLLAILFYLILFPVSILYRLFNKDTLMLYSKYDSHFIEINKDFEKETFEKPW